MKKKNIGKGMTLEILAQMVQRGFDGVAEDATKLTARVAGLEDRVIGLSKANENLSDRLDAVFRELQDRLERIDTKLAIHIEIIGTHEKRITYLERQAGHAR